MADLIFGNSVPVMATTAHSTDGRLGYAEYSRQNAPLCRRGQNDGNLFVGKFPAVLTDVFLRWPRFKVIRVDTSRVLAFVMNMPPGRDRADVLLVTPTMRSYRDPRLTMHRIPFSNSASPVPATILCDLPQGFAHLVGPAFIALRRSHTLRRAISLRLRRQCHVLFAAGWARHFNPLAGRRGMSSTHRARLTTEPLGDVLGLELTPALHALFVHCPAFGVDMREV